MVVEEGPGEAVEGQGGGPIVPGGDFLKQQMTLSLQLLLGKGRGAEAVGEQREGGFQVAGEALRAKRDRVPARRRPHAPGAGIEQVLDLLGPQRLGAPGEHPGHQSGEPVVLLGLVAEPAEEGAPERDQRHRPLLADDHRRPTGQSLHHHRTALGSRATQSWGSSLARRTPGGGGAAWSARRLVERGVDVGLGELCAGGKQASHHRGVEGEVLPGHLPDRIGGEGRHPGVVALLGLETAQRRLIVPQPSRPALHRLPGVDRLALHQRLEGSQLLLGGWGGDQLGECAQRLGEGGAGLRRGQRHPHPEQPRVERGVGVGAHLVDQACGALHLPLEPAGLALAGEHRQHVEGRDVLVVAGGDGEGDVEPGLLGLVGDEVDAAAQAERLRRAIAPRRAGPAPVAPEELVRPGADRFERHVAHRDQGHRLGGVVASVEVEDALLRRGPHALRRPEHGEPVGVHLVALPEQVPRGAARRGVLGALDLLHHHLALPGQLAGVEGGEADRVAQDVQPLPGELGGHDRVVDGVVEGGPGVDLAAVGLDVAGDLPGAAAGRPPKSMCSWRWARPASSSRSSAPPTFTQIWNATTWAAPCGSWTQVRPFSRRWQVGMLGKPSKDG
jgi:hypothetical protein